MNYPRICDGQRQPCPSPWACESGCNFNNAEKECAQDRAARQFIEMDLPIQMLDEEPDEKPPFAGVLLLWACGLVTLCLLGSLVVQR